MPENLNLENVPYWPISQYFSRFSLSKGRCLRCDEKALVDEREAHFTWAPCSYHNSMHDLRWRSTASTISSREQGPSLRETFFM